MKKALLILSLLCLGNNYVWSQKDTLRVVYYNVLKFPGSTGDRADSIRVIMDYLKPDILCLTELNNEAGADLILNTSLNHSNVQYARTPYLNGFDTETIVMYNAVKLGLAGFDSISTAGSTAAGSSRYIGYTRLYYRDPFLAVHRDTQYIDVIGMHLTAAQGVTQAASRQVQARMLKAWMDNRPYMKYILAGGDLNVYTSQEPSYQILLDSGTQKLYDPINAPGDWHFNTAFNSIHTQSTRTRAFNGGATGGLDDRFDFILASDSIMWANSPLKYIQGTYKAVGNNGQLFKDSLTHPPISTEVPWPVLSAMYNSSDHLPVYMELEVVQRIIVSLRDAENGVQVFGASPNPCQGPLRIRDLRSIRNGMRLSLTDLSGRTLQILDVPSETETLEVDLSAYPSGMYLIKAESEGQSHVQKIILN